jgi:hypothetical protein
MALEAVLAIACGACASHSDVRFAPAIQDTELRGEADDVQARIVIAWRGIAQREDVLELRFRIRVENPGAVTFTLVPAEFELLDGALTSFGTASAESVPIAVEARSSTIFDLAFPVPRAALEGFDLSALTLRTRLQGERWNWSTIFQRAVPVHHDPYCPPWSFHFGVVLGS